MMRRLDTALAAAVVLVGLLPAAQAQQPSADFGLIDGTIVFIDADSDARCGAVNTFNADFILRSCDRRLVLLSGSDRLTPFSVDENYDVFHDSGQPAGRIRFASDNDGARQVFWLSDETFPEGENLVLNYADQTDQLEVATVTGQDDAEVPLAPINISQTQCDPFATYDGGNEVLCPDTCGIGIGASGFLLTLWLGLGQRCRLRKRARTKS